MNASAGDDGQDAHTTREQPSPKTASPSTAALRSVGVHHVAVVEESVEDGGGEDVVAEHLAPINWNWLKLIWAESFLAWRNEGSARLRLFEV